MDDPTESNNVAAENPDVVAELQEYFNVSQLRLVLVRVHGDSYDFLFLSRLQPLQ